MGEEIGEGKEEKEKTVERFSSDSVTWSYNSLMTE